MGNPLLNQANQQSSKQGNNILQEINRLKSLGPSQVIFDQMYQNNQDFRRFADTVRNMTPEQAFEHYGFDFSQVQDQKW